MRSRTFTLALLVAILGGLAGGSLRADEAAGDGARREQRFREHLATRGAVSGGELVRLATPSVGPFRLFGWRRGQALQHRAAVSPDHLVGGLVGEAVPASVFPLLRAAQQVGALLPLAEALAWLRSDFVPGAPALVRPGGGHGTAPRGARLEVLRPGDRASYLDRPGAPFGPGRRALDPLLLARVTEPGLGAGPGGQLTFTGWFVVATGGREPFRIILTAAATGPARLTVAQASALGPLPADTGARAVAALRWPTADRPGLLWGLHWAEEQRDPRAVPALCELLERADERIRERALLALSQLGDRRSLPALTGRLDRLGRQARPAGTSERGLLRHALLQLARQGEAAAIEAIARSLELETDEGSRLQSVHALRALGPAGQPTLRRLARRDPSAAVRRLATGYLAPSR